MIPSIPRSVSFEPSRVTPLPPGWCLPDQLADHLRIWLKVAEALAVVHDRGVIHHDIEPDNVMVGALGEVDLLSIPAILVGIVATGALDVRGSMNGAPPEVVYVQHLLLVPIGTAIYAIGAEPRAWPAVAFASALTVAGILRPDLVMWFTLLTQLLVIEVLAIVSIWGARDDEGTERAG